MNLFEPYTAALPLCGLRGPGGADADWAAGWAKGALSPGGLDAGLATGGGGGPYVNVDFAPHAAGGADEVHCVWLAAGGPPCAGWVDWLIILSLCASHCAAAAVPGSCWATGVPVAFAGYVSLGQGAPHSSAVVVGFAGTGTSGCPHVEAGFGAGTGTSSFADTGTSGCPHVEAELEGGKMP